MIRPTLVALLLALLLLLPSRPAGAAPAAQGARCQIFYETGGFSVCDDGNALFLSAFQRWGLQSIGFPISRRYERDGFVTQAFQKAIMQWRPDGQYVALANIFDDLHAQGFDATLLQMRQTPLQFPPDWDTPDATFEQVVQRRQGLLAARPALQRAYFAAADPLLFFGLPTSDITDMGNHYAIRLQRAVLQEWKEAVPWAAAGQVTIANGADIAKELGGLPTEALAPDGGALSDGFEQFLAGAALDIDTFWSTLFTSISLPYTSNVLLQPYNGPVPTPCGLTIPFNAFYCPVSVGVYYHLDFLRWMNDQYGDYAAVSVLAHEWGHHAQMLLGIERPFNITHELIADCFMGAYTYDTQVRGRLEPGDFEEAQAALAFGGDPADAPWNDPLAHGGAADRLAAFQLGYDQGVAACLEGY